MDATREPREDMASPKGSPNHSQSANVAVRKTVNTRHVCPQGLILMILGTLKELQRCQIRAAGARPNSVKTRIVKLYQAVFQLFSEASDNRYPPCQRRRLVGNEIFDECQLKLSACCCPSEEARSFNEKEFAALKYSEQDGTTS
jgi:hypothetical protein